MRGEEAAKALILVDVMRLGWSDSKAAAQHLRHFSDHVARGIYTMVTASSPATFKEVREQAERLRRSKYLDGPNDVDWTFRNEIESAREEALYVDYVKYDDGHQWITPKDRFPLEPWPANIATKLVLAMERLGFFARGGLEHIRSAWSGAEVQDHLHWQENVDRNHAALVSIANAGLITDRATNQDVEDVLRYWGFPLGTLSLRKRDVPNEELEQERANAMSAIYRDLYGSPER